MTRDRLPAAHGERVDRTRSVSFFLDGRRVHGLDGDTVGSAMAAAGMQIIGRSFKYHRPRGLMCMAGACPNCLVTVDGVPNVRACTEPVRSGMRVQRQNGRPSVDRDVLGILNRFSWAMPAGFYYKIFHKPKWVWPKVEPIIRSVAGLGKVPTEPDHEHKEKVRLNPDVLVVGGGAAGLAAAIEAARTGADTVLVEERTDLGGHLAYRPVAAADPTSISDDGHRTALTGPDLARRMVGAARDAGVTLLAGAAAFGVFEGPLVAAASDSALYRIRARRTVFATGAIEQPAVFPDNDLPGIMLAGAVDRLIALYRILPGTRAVVLALGPEGHATARALADAGADVTVVDPDPAASVSLGTRPLTLRAGETILRAFGKRQVRAVEVGRPGEEGSARLTCDLVVVGGMLAPTTNLLAQAGATLEWSEAAGAFLPATMPDGMAAAGEVTGLRTTDDVIAQGRRAGLEAARALGYGDDATDHAIEELAAREPSPAERTLAPARIALPGKQFACLCMDVTDKELKYAVGEGFDSIELLKRYTTLSMGPCQGKACLTSSIRLCAAATRQTIPETGTPTARPPWTPVPMSVLAAEELVPRKETSMHDLHADAGAEFMWAGDWRRAHHYIHPAKEAESVHTGVAVIDVSSLGKLRVKGPDAAPFLERLYPNRFADLAVDRIRYGVMLNDSGVILDDGTIVRLAEDEFFVTTTTSGAASILRWMEWWLAVWRMDVLIAPISAQFAAVNVAGPRSRSVMERLTDLDVSAEGLPYLRAARATVAGVPSLVLRIGFTGELGYEIHFPSAYGEHVWERIMEAGREFGIQPFGLEAQRIVRLEKQHILVGQDTDALSDPFGVGMPWIVKMDKEDFLGRQALSELQDEGPPAERLVGWFAPGRSVPPEGAAIVDAGRWIGRVTSSRSSAAGGGVIGMGWVPASFAEEGRDLEIRFEGQVMHANVRLKPFYDAEGARLRS